MADRLLTKTNLLSLALLAAVMHAAAGMMRYLLPMDQFTESMMDLPLMAAAVFFLLYLLRRDGLPRPPAAQILLFLFLLWFSVSCLSASFRDDPLLGGDNTRPFLNALISCLLFFPLGCALSREKTPPVGKILLHACMLIWTAFIVYAVVCVFQGKNTRLPGGGYIAMVNDSLQINCNRNTTGSWEMLFFLGCFLLLLRCKSPALKAVYGLALAVHYTALILSNSRASVFSTLVCFGAITFIAVFRLLKKQPTFRRAALSLGCAALAAAAFYLLRGAVFRLYAADTGSATAGARALTEKNANNDITANRLLLWKAAVEGVFSSAPRALLGVTPRGVPRMITLFSGLYDNTCYSHNQILEIACAAGLPAMCLMLCWFALILRDTARILINKNGQTLLKCLSMVMLTLATVNMVEAYLIFYDFPGGYVFFFLCGLIHGAAKRGRTPGASSAPGP